VRDQATGVPSRNCDGLQAQREESFFVRIFVSEYITSGALGAEPLPPTLAREGAAMVAAVLRDLTRLPGWTIQTTLDRRFQRTLEAVTAGVEVAWVVDPLQAGHTFDAAAAHADLSLMIAPETGGVLQARVERVRALGGTCRNCSPDAIALCGDKLALASVLEQSRIPTIPTRPLPLGTLPWDVVPGPSVVKPRDGAGSWLTRRLDPGQTQAWNGLVALYQAAGRSDSMLVQPFLPGTPVSVACLCEPGELPEILPVAAQHLTHTDFEYLGGTVPADVSPAARSAVQDVARLVCATIPGLCGYVGLDLILPENRDADAVVVEINPRLTTSFVGYQRLCRDNLGQRLVTRGPALRWKDSPVPFRADGS